MSQEGELLTGFPGAGSSSISIEHPDPVVLVRMHHGEDNGLHPDLLSGLEQILDSVEGADGPAALVLTGTGKFFSTGLDLQHMAAHPDQAGETLDRVHRLLGRVLGLGVPTLAAINGHAFGAGAMLALACDVAVMRSDRGYLCLPEADLGLTFSPGMQALLTARLSPPVAHEAMVTARRYGAPEAVAAGMVVAAVPEGELVNAAVERAAAIAGKPRHSLAEIKAALYPWPLELLVGALGGAAS